MTVEVQATNETLYVVGCREPALQAALARAPAGAVLQPVLERVEDRGNLWRVVSREAPASGLQRREPRVTARREPAALLAGEVWLSGARDGLHGEVPRP